MPWTEAFERWALLGAEFCADFPFLDRVAIQRFRGDYHALTEYLANTHDLTLAEAADALEDWLAFRVVSCLKDSGCACGIACGQFGPAEPFFLS